MILQITNIKNFLVPGKEFVIFLKLHRFQIQSRSSAEYTLFITKHNQLLKKIHLSVKIFIQYAKFCTFYLGWGQAHFSCIKL